MRNSVISATRRIAIRMFPYKRMLRFPNYKIFPAAFWVSQFPGSMKPLEHAIACLRSPLLFTVLVFHFVAYRRWGFRSCPHFSTLYVDLFVGIARIRARSDLNLDPGGFADQVFLRLFDRFRFHLPLSPIPFSLSPHPFPCLSPPLALHAAFWLVRFPFFLHLGCRLLVPFLVRFSVFCFRLRMFLGAPTTLFLYGLVVFGRFYELGGCHTIYRIS